MKRSEINDLKNELANRFGWICWYCGIQVVPDYKRIGGSVREDLHRAAHLDHIVPKASGGPNRIENLALACGFCNRAKLNFTVDVFLDWLDGIRFGKVNSPIVKILPEIPVVNGRWFYMSSPKRVKRLFGHLKPSI